MAKNIIVQPIYNKVVTESSTIKVNVYTFTGPSTSGSGGATAFVNLIDVPNSYIGQALKLTRVNAGETGLEFFTAPYITSNQTITLSGDVSGSGSTAITTTIGANKVTYAKIQQITALSLVGNPISSTANAQAIGLGAGLSFSGTNIINSGVTSIVAGTDINVSGPTGAVTINNISTLASVTGRGNTTSTGISLNQNGGLSSSYNLYLKRNNDSTPLGYYIKAQNAAGNANIFTVDTTGNLISNSYAVTGGTSSQFLKADGTLDSTAYIPVGSAVGQLKATLRAKTDVALPANTYDNGVLGVGATLTGNVNGALPSIDGVSLIVGESLLVSEETSTENNGIYVITDLGDVSNPYVLTRSTEMDEPTDFIGSLIAINNEGTLNHSTIWIVNFVAGTFIVGTSPVVLSLTPGLLPETNGGTNQSSYTTGDILYSSATNILSKLGIGSTNQVLTVVGGIPSWQTPVAGFTNPMTTLGDIIYENATPDAARLAGNITTTKKFLSQTGTGSISAAPLWDTLSTSDIPSAALTKTDDTNVTLTLGGSPGSALLAATSLTLGWTGTLADGRIASASNWNTAYTNRITSLTTTGNNGSATLVSNILNVPTYTLAGLGGTTLATVNAQNLSVFAATTSAQLAGVISDETGTGALVFADSPVFTGTPTLGILSYLDTGILWSWQSSTNSYNQVIIQNTNAGTAASTNYLVSNDLGTSSTKYGEFGMNSSGFTGSGAFNLPNAVYLDAISDDLVIGTIANKSIHFVTNNSTTDVLTLGGNGSLTYSSALGTVTANNTYSWTTTTSATSRATASDSLGGYDFNSSLTANAATIDLQGVTVDFTPIATGGITTLVAHSTSSPSGMTPQTTNATPASTSGSGTSASINVTVTGTTITFNSVTTAGSGYKVGDTVTFNGSQFGGSGSVTFSVTVVSGSSFGSTTSALIIKHNLGDVSGLTKRYIDFRNASGTSLGNIAFSYSISSGSAAPNMIITGRTSSITFGSSIITMNNDVSFGGNNLSSIGTINSSTITTSGALSNTNNVSGLSGSAYTSSGLLGAFTSTNQTASAYRGSNTVSVGVVNTVSITAAGSGYTNGTKTTTGGTGSGATFSITQSGGAITIATPSNRGTGYTVNDVLTVSGGTGGQLTVTAVDFSGGVICTLWENSSYSDSHSAYIYTTINSTPTFNITSTGAGATWFAYFNPTYTNLGSFTKGGIAIVPTGTINGIGTGSPTANLHITGGLSATSWTTIGSQLALGAATYTDTGTTGTRATGVAIGIGRPTYASTNAVTVSDAATLYIANDVAAGSNMTLTRTHALWVASGISRFDGKVQVGSGISIDGGGLKHTRVTTGSIAGGSTGLITITWTTAFADANYTVTADVIDSTTSSLSLSVVHIESVSASAVTVRVLNNAVGALTGTLNVIAIHD